MTLYYFIFHIKLYTIKNYRGISLILGNIIIFIQIALTAVYFFYKLHNALYVLHIHCYNIGTRKYKKL